MKRLAAPARPSEYLRACHAALSVAIRVENIY